MVNQNPPSNSFKVMNNKLSDYNEYISDNESDYFQLAPETLERNNIQDKLNATSKRSRGQPSLLRTSAKSRPGKIFHQAQDETVEYQHGSNDELSGDQLQTLSKIQSQSRS